MHIIFGKKNNPTALFPNVSSNLVLLQSKKKQTGRSRVQVLHQDFTILTEGFKSCALYISNDKKVDKVINSHTFLLRWLD